MVKSTCCFCRGPGFVPNTHVIAYNQLTPVLGKSDITHLASIGTRHTHTVHLHISRQNSQTHKNKLIF